MNKPVLRDITAVEAHRLLDGDAVLVDIRELHEQTVESIPGAIALPLSVLARGEPVDLPNAPAIFFCASGARTQRNAAALAALANGEAYGLAGGIRAWRAAGFPVRGG